MKTDAPALPAPLAARWGVRSATLIADTPSSHVFRADMTDGATAIAKLLKPDGIHERPGMDFLELRNGAGTARLIDRAVDACLIEDAGKLTLSQHRLTVGDDASNRIIVEVLGRLHADGDTPARDSAIAALTPLRLHFHDLFERAARPDVPELSNHLCHAARIAEELLAAQVGIRPLHGDLHHDNILFSPRGWLAIDPQGLLGDPAYEVANVFGNPDGAFDEIIRPERILGLARLFAGTLGCSEAKILRYALAHAGVSVCWSLKGGKTLKESDNARERLAFLQVASSLLADGAFSAQRP